MSEKSTSTVIIPRRPVPFMVYEGLGSCGMGIVGSACYPSWPLLSQASAPPPGVANPQERLPKQQQAGPSFLSLWARFFCPASFYIISISPKVQDGRMNPGFSQSWLKR